MNVAQYPYFPCPTASDNNNNKKTICHLSGQLYGRTSQDGVGFPKSEERSMEQEEGKKAGQQRTFIGCYSKCGRKSSCWTIALNMQISKHNTEPTGPVSWRCMKYVFQRRALHCLHMAHPSRSSCSKLSLPLSFYGCVGAQSLCLSVVSDSFAIPMDCSPPGSSVHGISQAKILEWVAISSSSGSS